MYLSQTFISSMLSTKCFAFIIGILLYTINLSATTIIPFENIAAMGQNGDAVVLATAEKAYEVQDGDITRFRTQFAVLDNLKGNLSIGERFALQALKKKIGSVETIIAGDVEFEIGKTYLLFLVNKAEAPFWQPMLLSYGIHVEQVRDGNTYLVPNEQTLEMSVAERPDEVKIEPLAAFFKEPLLQHLAEVLGGRAIWNAQSVNSKQSVNSFYPENVGPSYCSNLGGNFRWENFPEQAINLYSEDDGDMDFSPASAVHGLVPNVISTMESNYPGIDLNYAGTANFNPSSCLGGATSDEFVNFIAPLGKRNTLIQYNDPCDEIANLNGCSGTLAIGGSYVSTTHTFNGETFRSQQWGYVVFNESVRSCYSQDVYISTMIHELTHSLGLDHIPSSSGVANMNPSGAANITTLDRACMNSLYPAGDPTVPCSNSPISVNTNPIPSDTYASNGVLTSRGRVANGSNVLFQAANSITLQNDFRVDAGGNFTAEIVNCATLTDDNAPITYKLLNEMVLTAEIIQKNGFNIQPNPVNFNTQIVLELAQSSAVQLAIYDLNGQLKKWILQSEVTPKGTHNFSVDAALLSEGMYYVTMQANGETFTKKMVVVR